jgi:hypothetical protein
LVDGLEVVNILEQYGTGLVVPNVRHNAVEHFAALTLEALTFSQFTVVLARPTDDV